MSGTDRNECSMEGIDEDDECFPCCDEDLPLQKNARDVIQKLTLKTDSKTGSVFRTTRGPNAAEKKILIEVLRCAVCLELPKGNKKVPMCGQGHHFCYSCRSKIDICAICRGSFYDSRNFAVEKFMSKAGTKLGILKNYRSLEQKALPYPKGRFYCLHGCKYKITAGHYIYHLRTYHKSSFVERVQFNPHNGRFEYILDFDFQINTSYVKTFNVGDFGLFTINIRILDKSLVAYMQMLTNTKNLTQIRCNLTLESYVKNTLMDEISASNLRLLNYTPVQDLNDLKHKNILKLVNNLFDEFNVPKRESKIVICIWNKKRTALAPVFLDRSHYLADSAPFQYDRRVTRNISRNMRRKKYRDLKRSSKAKNKKG